MKCNEPGLSKAQRRLHHSFSVWHEGQSIHQRPCRTRLCFACETLQRQFLDTGEDEFIEGSLTGY